MKTKFLYIIILPLLCLASATSCVHEFAVVDNSFEFVADVTYDGGANQHRLTLTRKSGAPDNQYKIAFTLDGESTMTLTDANGMTIEGFFNESFDDVSTRTYTLSTIAPGEHTLNLEITTEEFSQSLAVTFVVEDFSFEFDTRVVFDQKSKTHSLEVTLKEGSPTDTYTIAFTVDNKEPRKTYQETFTDAVVKTYELQVQEPGEHTVNLQITTAKHSQKADLPYKVNDYSFKLQADIEYDSENLSHMLFLTLLEGSRDETYTVSYTVDGGHAVKLLDDTGKELGASFKEDFKDATVRSYDLSRAEKGKHTMKMIVSTDDFSQVLEIPYVVDALPFTIHAEMETSGSSSVMMLTLKEGDAATEYNASIILDSKTIASPKVNFSRNPIYRYTLPTTRPGKHDVSVQLTDGYTVEKTSVSYNEPVRHPYLDITLKYNENSGKHIAEIGSNPYDISLKFVTSLTLKGQTTVCIYDWSVWGEKRYETKTKTMSDSNTASGIYGGNSVTLIDRDALVTKLTGSYEMSDVVEYFYDPGSGGEDSGREWYEVTGTERKYYVLKEETLKIDISGEKVSGVTLRVTNKIGAMTLNGKSSSSGTTSIAL
ncbi:MAG: hypothetical protein IKW27_06105 [Bacteroidales bacterium]|nr:hypothetical protein [Bacteroidales bacterium]MBR5568297.1 hypothetical protein [Bacteroidales bacterium]